MKGVQLNSYRQHRKGPKMLHLRTRNIDTKRLSTRYNKVSEVHVFSPSFILRRLYSVETFIGPTCVGFRLLIRAASWHELLWGAYR